MRTSDRGFTLIELLIVIAIIGILAAIAIPNLLNAIQRGRQKRTMSDMRALAVAIEAYNVDNSSYPPAGCANPSWGTAGTPVADTGFTALTPTYIAEPPRRDGWRNNFLYFVDNVRFEYNIRSLGRNGAADSVNCGTTTNFDDDIIYASGAFVQWPEGVQN